jgi:hypothetical protein
VERSRFELRISPEDRERLRDLAGQARTNESAVVRYLIRAATATPHGGIYLSAATAEARASVPEREQAAV